MCVPKKKKKVSVKGSCKEEEGSNVRIPNEMNLSSRKSQNLEYLKRELPLNKTPTKKETLHQRRLTLKDDTLAGGLQRLHRLLVSRLTKAHLIHGYDGVADEELTSGVRRQTAENLRDENGHAILATALDADAEAVAGSLPLNGHHPTSAAAVDKGIIGWALKMTTLRSGHLIKMIVIISGGEAFEGLIERQLKTVAVQLGVHLVPVRLGEDLEGAASFEASTTSLFS